jgi:hypothetical protein
MNLNKSFNGYGGILRENILNIRDQSAQPAKLLTRLID